MSREVHVRFWEGLGVRLPRATRLPFNAKFLKRERLVESFPNRRSRPRMIGFEGRGQALQPTLRNGGVAERPRFCQYGLHARMQTVWEMAQNVSLLVDLTAMDDTQGTEHFPEG